MFCTVSSPFFSEDYKDTFYIYKALYAHSLSVDRKMIYILIINLLTREPSYLLRQQSLLCPLVSQAAYKYICKFFIPYVRGKGLLTPLFPGGIVFVHSDCPRERVPPAPLIRVPG